MIRKIVEKLRGELKDILIIGDVMIDEYVFGSVNRISPEAPVPVLREENKEWSLGGAANVALNCRHIGCNVSLIGLVGTDSYGDLIIKMLEKKKVSTRGIFKSSARVTTCKRRMMAKNHQLMRADLEDNFALKEEERKRLYELMDSLIKPNSIIIVSDYAKGVIDDDVMRRIITKTNEQSVMILVDPKGPDFSKYKGATYIKPNFKEFCEILDFLALPREASLSENARKICNILSLKGIVVTKGEEGMTFVSCSEDEEFIPSAKCEVFDLTGAGDTVISFLAVGLLCSLSMKECLVLASKAAAIAVSHLKTYAVSLEDLTKDYIESAEKYYHDWNQLKNVLDSEKNNRKRVVFTNGCFDILHSGHIHILKESKKQGDILVVALNSDASVKRLKGDSRPIKPLDERANVMSALGMVDYVTVFEEDTPLNAISFLKPDILAKGVDYQAEDVVGYKEVKAYGGEVVIIGWKNKHSTTTFVEKLSQNSESSEVS